MTNDLYFIPLLMQAFERADLAEGLRQAFRTIITLGKNERFRSAYAQFLAFMDAVAAAHKRQDRARGGVSITLGATDETRVLLEELAACPELAEAWEGIKEDLEMGPEPTVRIKFVLRRNADALQELGLSRDQRKGEMTRLVPGSYQLLLASGQVLWEVELTAQDLLLAYARPEEPLRIAADTGGTVERPTRQTTLLDGEIAVRIFAGLTTGRMEVEWC